MNSPSSIDLDMNLLDSSPVPRARHVDDAMAGAKSNGGEESVANQNGGVKTERNDIQEERVIGRTNDGTSGNALESADSGGSNERSTKNGGKPTAQNFESWRDDLNMMRDDLYMMNVKNSILLDDLVKLGADV